MDLFFDNREHTNGYPCYEPQTQIHATENELFIILLSYAIIEPLTMVIEPVTAPVARVAMLGEFADPHLADCAKGFVLIDILFI